MKKILLAAFAAIAITSCSQNEEFDNQSANNEINFNTGVSNATRAVMTTNDTFTSFNVKAYEFSGATFTGDVVSTVISDGTYSKNDNKWGSTTHYYWPASTENKVAFFGYGGATNVDYTAPAPTKLPTLGYTILTDVSKQEDLVVTQQSVAKTANAISLSFKHALTQVYFKLKGNNDDLTYTVEKIAIKQAKGTGTFTYDATANFGTWTATSTLADYTITHPQTVVGTTAAEAYGDAAQIMILMPQTLEGVTVEITYSVKRTVGDEEIRPSVKASWDLTGEWKSGQKVAYLLTLNVDEVTLEGSIAADEEWAAKTEDEGGATSK